MFSLYLQDLPFAQVLVSIMLPLVLLTQLENRISDALRRLFVLICVLCGAAFPPAFPAGSLRAVGREMVEAVWHMGHVPLRAFVLL